MEEPMQLTPKKQDAAEIKMSCGASEASSVQDISEKKLLVDFDEKEDYNHMVCKRVRKYLP